MKLFLKKNGRYSDIFMKISMYLVLQALLPFVMHISVSGALDGYELYRMREHFTYIVCAFCVSIVFYLVMRLEENYRNC